MTAPDRVQELEFLFNPTVTVGNQKREVMNLKIWLNKLKNGHLMGYHVAIF